MFSAGDYDLAKKSVAEFLPLNSHIIYSLPEGLWVFCITLTSGSFYIKQGKFFLAGSYIPILFAVGLELMQLCNITYGRFDFWDIGFALFFWQVAQRLNPAEDNKNNILRDISFKTIFCVSSYSIIYFSHVML